MGDMLAMLDVCLLFVHSVNGRGIFELQNKR